MLTECKEAGFPNYLKITKPPGSRNRSRPLQKLLDDWGRNWSISGLTPWLIYDDYDLRNISWNSMVNLRRIISFFNTRLQCVYTNLPSSYTGLLLIKCSKYKDRVLLLKSNQKNPCKHVVTTTLLARTWSIRKSDETCNVF